MYETAIRLGRGIIRNGCSPLTDVKFNGFFLDVISRFGISREDLKKIKPSYNDLLEIYSELMHFGFSTKYYLKQKPSKT
jgi:hypothetical protein